MADYGNDVKLYRIKSGRYSSSFIKAVAMAIHREVLEPEELEYMLTNMGQPEITQILYERVK